MQQTKSRFSTFMVALDVQAHSYQILLEIPCLWDADANCNESWVICRPHPLRCHCALLGIFFLFCCKMNFDAFLRLAQKGSSGISDTNPNQLNPLSNGQVWQ